MLLDFIRLLFIIIFFNTTHPDFLGRTPVHGGPFGLEFLASPLRPE